MIRYNKYYKTVACICYLCIVIYRWPISKDEDEILYKAFAKVSRGNCSTILEPTREVNVLDIVLTSQKE